MADMSQEPAWLAAGGEMAGRIRSQDWSKSSLGPLGTWPEHIRTAVRICLGSLQPVLLWIGPELSLVYNDACILLLGTAKHPAALGASGRDVWREIWPSIGPMHAAAAAGKVASVEDMQIFVERHRPREEVYLTLSPSPIFSAEHAIDGVFCVCTETTEQVISGRRLLTLRDLAKRCSQPQTVKGVCRAAARIMRANPIDLPFAAIYLFDESEGRAERVAAFHAPGDADPFPEYQSLDPHESLGPWPFAALYERRAKVQVHELPQNAGSLQSGPWPDAVDTAMAFPLWAHGQTDPAGALIAGVNARRVLDASYGTFLELCAQHIGAAIAEARARELLARQPASRITPRGSEQRERNTEARLQAAVDLVRLGLYAWDPQTNELEWDDTVRAMWGLEAGAPVDYGIWRGGIHADDKVRVDESIRRAVDPQTNGVYDVDYRVVGRDGIERWVATRGITHFENGKPITFSGVAIDITERKRVESELERRVEARTAELVVLNRQLRAQIEQRAAIETTLQQLQRLDAIGQITSGVAHDFNNLLGVVLTNVVLMEHKSQRPEERRALAVIREAAERGAKLTSQLLAFPRGQPLEPQAVDLNTKILALNDLLVVTLGDAAHLTIKLAPQLWSTWVDPTQLELIILNLTINGRDAMKRGGELAIETHNAVIASPPTRPADPSPGRYVCLAVTDTGDGIPDDVLPHVFEPFFTTKGSGKGSGLGLAQVHSFAKKSGGGVRIDTRLGEGTSVSVFLPCAESVASRHHVPLTHTGRRSTQAEACVLVVDDDAIVLKSTVTMLKLLGYTVASAESGARALDVIVADQRIGVVLADFAMPGMNGAELSEAIRAIRPRLPVVLLTGNADLDGLRHFSESRILQKPYSEGDLVAKISAALN